MSRVPGWLWLVWVAEGVLLEGVAIGTRTSGDTLTETILRTFPGIVVLVAVTWIGVHFGRRVLENWRRK